jgi:hypothetical protein
MIGPIAPGDAGIIPGLFADKFVSTQKRDKGSGANSRYTQGKKCSIK